MADPPDVACAAHATTPPTTAPASLQPDAISVGTEDASTTNMDIVATQTNAAPDSDTNAAAVEDNLAAADRDAAASASLNNITLAPKSITATHKSSTATPASQQPGEESEENAAALADSNPSLFAKLPGELRNRIYRAYFEDSARQRKHTMNIKKAAPTFLNLFHTDRMIRSEAASIFFKEFLSMDSFFVPMDLEDAIKSRIKSICALLAIHDMDLSLSITVQESIVGESYYVRDLRSDFVGKLMRFITNETNEWFSRNTDSQNSDERTRPPADQSMRSSRMVHSSHRCRLERLPPVMSNFRSLIRFIVDTEGHINARPLLGLQGAYQPIREGANFLRVEGPLTDLDWTKFEWSTLGAFKRSQSRVRVHRGR